MVPCLVGWSLDETHVLLRIGSIQEWVPVVADGENEYCSIGATRYLIGATKLTPQ